MNEDCATNSGDDWGLASCESSTKWVGYSKFSPLLLGLLAALFLALAILAIVTREIIVASVVVLAVLIIVDLYRFDLQIDATGFSYRAFLGFPAKHIPLSDIHSMTTTTITAWDWGGWGFRGLGKKIGVITAEGKGIHLEYADDRVVVVSCKEADHAVAVFHNLTASSPVKEISD